MMWIKPHIGENYTDEVVCHLDGLVWSRKMVKRWSFDNRRTSRGFLAELIDINISSEKIISSIGLSGGIQRERKHVHIT